MREYKNFGGLLNMANLEQIDARRPIKTPYDLEADRATWLFWAGVFIVTGVLIIIDNLNPAIVDKVLG